MIPTAANGQPALVTYQLTADGALHAHGVQVLTLAGSSVTRVVSFNDPELVAAFGMPPVLPDSAADGAVPR
jgi:RNA polymerase sigma-70 factor (ECF subfamily)